MKNQFSIFLVSLLAVFMVSCGSSDSTIVIDNPTDAAIKVAIADQFEYEVQATSKEELVVPAGTYTMTYGADGSSEVTFKGGEEYLINPTGASYLMEQIVYGDALAQATGNVGGPDLLPMDSIEILGISIPGNYKKFDDLVTEKIWHFGLDEEAPEQIEISSTSSGAKRIQLYRESEYLNLILEAMMQSVPEEEAAPEPMEEVMLEAAGGEE